ncbi:MAG: DUF1592 domain-containing protein [Chthoniobacteraceae bacterium]
MLRPRLTIIAALGLLLPFPAAFADTSAFAQAGVPFLEKHCVSCHGKEKQKGDFALHEFRDDLSVLRARKRWRDVVEQVRSGDMPPDDKPQPSADEKKRFLESVAGIFSKADNGKPDPGRLTVRRLNRNEYNNSIRDLLHIEFRPADDFPSDDVGHGFDNIADVLTVSPVLMERYLDAADKIAAQAIPLSATTPPKRTMSAKFCEPASANVPQSKFRPLTASEGDAVKSGPINTPVRITADGDYIMRARLYAKSADGKPVRVAMMVTGGVIAKPSSAGELAKLDGAWLGNVKRAHILKSVEITGKSENEAQTIEAKVPRLEGIERIVLAAFKPQGGQPAPTLFVEWLEYEGPMDARSAATKSLLTATPGKPQAEQTREILARFAVRAWRRPVTGEELDRLTKLVAYAMGHNDTWEEAMRRAVSAVLASPKFVFRLEPDDQPQSAEPHAVDEFQLATRLSYFLWSSCPDDELLRIASEKKLSTGLDAQIKRMIQDPKADALIENFAMQWLQLGRLASHSTDPKTFPSWKTELGAAMVEETRRYFGEIVRTDRSVLDLLDGDFTWVNQRLSELYRIKDAGTFQKDEWKRVSLAGTPRGGLLTQASILTVTSNPTRTSPVKRGKWVLEQLLGTPPPPAPPNIPSLDDSKRNELKGTFRQKLEQHRADPKCANCHAKMDAFGFALENFNGIGQWRDRDETGANIDASGKLATGREIKGLSDMKVLLRSRKQDFARCLTEKILIYALGRGLDWYDEPTITRIAFALEKNDYRFSTLISGIVRSPPFLMRRSTAQAEQK